MSNIIFRIRIMRIGIVHNFTAVLLVKMTQGRVEIHTCCWIGNLSKTATGSSNRYKFSDRIINFKICERTLDISRVGDLNITAEVNVTVSSEYI